MTKLSALWPPIDRDLARRAATRMAASVAVMSALGAISHDEPRDATPFQPIIRLGPDASPGIDLRQAALAEMRSEKTDRLRRPAPVREAALVPVKAGPERADGVLFFDRCRPLCESRDPLLPAHHVAQADIAPPEPVLQAASFETETTDAVAPPGGVLDVVSSGVSAVTQSGRTIIDGAARLLPW